MSYRVVGLRVEKFVGDVLTGHNCEFVMEKAECERHILCIQREEEKFGKKYNIKVEFSFEFDDTRECYSGWTTATYVHTGREKVEHFGALTHIPKEEIIISEMLRDGTPFNDFEEWDLDDERDYSLTIKDINGRNVASSSFNGGDEYYPCGDYDVNMDLFKETPRYPAKRPTYVFFGESGIGKSFLGHQLQGQIYETDSSPTLPDILRYDVIVVGNKHKFEKEDIKAKLPEETRMVVVNFAYED